MKKITLVAFLFLCVLTSYSKPSKHFLKNHISLKNSFITIIFKARTFKKDTVYKASSKEKLFKKNELYYSIQGNFIRYNIPKKNYKKNDTVKIYTNNDIMLSHDYYFSHYSLFQFKPGDIVEFDYPNEYPVCKILNRKFSDIDLNYMTKLKLETENTESSSEFFLKNNR